MSNSGIDCRLAFERSEAYRLLSDLYRPPDKSLLAAGVLAPLRAVMSVSPLSHLMGVLDEIESYLSQLRDVTDLAVEYVKLFRGPVKALVYPYESMYVDGEIMGPSTFKVLGLYTEAGLETTEELKDLPDHIAVQLEFMGHLYSWEAEGLKRGDQSLAARCAALRRSFIVEHLSQWVPSFAAAILDHAASPFYRGLALITKELIASETDMARASNRGALSAAE